MIELGKKKSFQLQRTKRVFELNIRVYVGAATSHLRRNTQ